ncbi:MAG: signal peptidase I [Sulfuricurvum sp.]
MREFLHKIYKFSNSWSGTIIIVLFVIFFVAQAFRIPSGSMKDSLLIGDHLFAKKFSYGIPMPHLPFLELSIMPWSDKLKLVDGDKPKRGDIVIFRPPNNIKQHFVKRCVALPKDEIFQHNKDLYLHPHEGDEYAKEHFKEYEFVVYNDKLFVKNPYEREHKGIHHDPKIIDNGYYPQPLFNFAPIVVEDDHYFMMGDNRDHSNDSRFWGSVPYENIEGSPWFIYFSIDDNYEIRWDRVGKTPSDLEGDEYLKRARHERELHDKDDHGIY